MEFLMEHQMTVVWLGLLIVFLIVEVVTVGLVSIWAAGGALAAVLVSMIPVGVGIQVAVFLIVTAVLLYFTRPFAVKILNARREKTNYESLIGKTVLIVERVDNINQTGMAVVNGQEWTIRSEKETETFEAGELVKVSEVSGVKLIVKRYEEA